MEVLSLSVILCDLLMFCQLNMMFECDVMLMEEVLKAGLNNKDCPKQVMSNQASKYIRF